MIHAFRLLPGENLRTALRNYCNEQKIEAAVLLSCVGSLNEAVLRFAENTHGTNVMGPLEIVSATGTLSRHGLHIHISVSDENGSVTGGHLMEGSSIRTTAEIVLQELDGFVFTREKDAATGYEELRVGKR